MRKVLTPARGAIAAALIAGLVLPAQAQGLRPALETGEAATREAEQVQNRINQLDDERSDMVREYRTLLQRRDASELYARQQEKVVESQQRELESLTEQLGRVDEITAQTVPMLLDMVTDLKTFVAADLPFKREERQTRLDALDAAMINPQVTTAERYRLIIEAYQAEMEYGRTVDTWEETIQIDGADVNVEMFNYGRIALVYISPNGDAARWDRSSNAWAPLSGSYASDIRQAVRIAEGKTQQAVMWAPVQKLSVGQ